VRTCRRAAPHTAHWRSTRPQLAKSAQLARLRRKARNDNTRVASAAHVAASVWARRHSASRDAPRRSRQTSQ
jgi:DNA-binding IclR family transcriptional regulator